MTHPELTRRTILTLGTAGTAAAVLAACSPSPESAGPTSSADSPTQPGDAATDSPAAGADGGTQVATLADIPVGGSIDAKLGDAPILLSQPEAGTVVGFSAICSHQQCVVAAAGGEFDCPCHGSKYDAATGDVLNGPALKPLTRLTVTVSGDAVLATA